MRTIPQALSNQVAYVHERRPCLRTAYEYEYDRPPVTVVFWQVQETYQVGSHAFEIESAHGIPEMRFEQAAFEDAVDDEHNQCCDNCGNKIDHHGRKRAADGA